MDQRPNWQKYLILGAHGLLGWALCGAIIGIGSAVTSMQTTLIVHAIGVPLIFAGLSLAYFHYFRFTTPVQTGLIFTGMAIFLDATVIALLVEKSYAMFASILGTWIPFAEIFLSTALVGLRSGKWEMEKKFTGIDVGPGPHNNN
jgi:hypothetical protein